MEEDITSYGIERQRTASGTPILNVGKYRHWDGGQRKIDGHIIGENIAMKAENREPC